MRSAVLVLLLALAGCASTEVRAPTPIAYAAETVQAQALAAGHAALSGQARRDNADAIDRLLAQLDDATLARDAARLPAGDPLYNFAGRVLQRRGLPLPHGFDRGDASFGAADRPAAERDGYRPPLKVAVLLPLSGNQAAAAQAVRDGYLAGYYGETRRRPALKFYDTAAGAKPALARAAADGNDFVVGPLMREEADALFAAGEPPVPMLALNRGSRTPPAGSAAFSLSPEDEGISLAQHLIDERRSKRVLLIAGSEDTQRRTADAAQPARRHIAELRQVDRPVRRRRILDQDRRCILAVLIDMRQVHLRIRRTRLRREHHPPAVRRETVPGIHQRRIAVHAAGLPTSGG